MSSHGEMGWLGILDGAGRVLASQDEAFGHLRQNLAGRLLTETLLAIEESEATAFDLSAFLAEAATHSRRVRVREASGRTRLAELCAVSHGNQATSAYAVWIYPLDVEECETSFIGNQQHILELIAAGASLEPILSRISQMVEREVPDVMVSVLLLDEDGKHLRHGASPSLPAGFAQAIDGAAIGPCAGSCGTAAWRRETVIVEDMATDPLWVDWKALALKSGCRACWSTPIFSPFHKVLGTLGLYCRESRQPAPQETRLAGVAARLAAIAIHRHQTERQMRQLFELQARVFEQFPALIWHVNPRLECVFLNQRYLKFRGRLLVEEQRAGWKEGIHPDDQPGFLAALDAAMAARQPFRLHHRLRRYDGEYRWMENVGSPLTDAQGRFAGYIGCCEDITERRNAEKQLEEQATLLDKAREAIVLCDLDGTVGYWSRGAERTYGWSREETTDRKIQELIYRDLAPYEQGCRLLLEKGEWSGELVHFNKAGEELAIESNWSLVRDTQGLPRSILSISSNITEQKQLQAQFLRAQRLESVGVLAGGIAHDLNNVLTPILMATHSLREGVRDPELAELLDMIQTNAQRGADVVQHLLSFARGVEGKRVPMHPEQLLKEIQLIVRETFPKNITANFQVEPGVRKVLCNPTQIQQVLLNLFVNARDAMPNGGRISLSVRNGHFPPAPDAQRFPPDPPETCVVLEVADNGSGIPAQVRDKLFKPFFTTKDVGKGTGLGLSTAQTIVRSHKGVLTLESEPGKGTIVSVCLPAHQSRGDTEQLRKLQDEVPRGQGELVLVVDDEAPVRNTYKLLLQRYGYRVVTATDGADAVQVFTRYQAEVSVVLMDMMMPVMDGPTAALALRKLQPGLRIIGSSGFASEAVIAQAAEAGFERFLGKPCGREELLRVLREVISSPVKKA